MVDQSSLQWHQRLGYLTCGSLAPLSMLCDFKLNKESLDYCDVCHRTKQTQNNFPLTESRASSPFDLVNCDLRGVIIPHLYLIVSIFCVLWIIFVV